MAVVLLKIFEDANLSGELKLSGRKLRDFPKAAGKYNLSDTVIAGIYSYNPITLLHFNFFALSTSLITNEGSQNNNIAYVVGPKCTSESAARVILLS